MIYIIILEILIFPLFYLFMKIFHEQNLITETNFGLFVIPYFGTIMLTTSQIFPLVSVGRFVFLSFSFFCIFPGYIITKWIYRKYFHKT
jgi:hypothetical protein